MKVGKEQTPSLVCNDLYVQFKLNAAEFADQNSNQDDHYADRIEQVVQFDANNDALYDALYDFLYDAAYDFHFFAELDSLRISDK